MGSDNVIFLEVLEWLDDTGQVLVRRVPESGSGEIKYGAQLTVRESQAAVFFYQGKAYDAFGPGRHTLQTANIPVLTKVLSLPWGFKSPLRAEVYFVNMKVFPNLKWGTRDPVAFKDKDLGLIRLRAFGMFDIRVVQPVLFINTITGTQGIYTTDDIGEYLSKIIVSRFNDLLGESLDTVFNLPGKYDSLAGDLKKRLQEDFSRYGLGLYNLYINSITPPLEVQKAIDDKSRLGVFDDLNKLLQMKSAMAIEEASKNQGAAGAGMGMGAGLMMPAMFAGMSGRQASNEVKCPGCGRPAPENAAFCPSCGYHLLIFNKCSKCGYNMSPGAAFCSKCGNPAAQKLGPKKCSRCGTENLQDSMYCNQCGEKL